MFRLGDAGDIADACIYLSAPAAKFVTGEVISVDGGQQLWGETWVATMPEYFSR
jgi:citronellol/citronellal dehydrogenase